MMHGLANIKEYNHIRCHNRAHLLFLDLNTAAVTRCRFGFWLSWVPGSGKRRHNLPYVLCRHYDSLRIGTRLRAGRLGNRLLNPSRDKLFSVLHSTQTGNGTHPAFPSVKQLGLFPPIARLRNAWS